ncbi:MAG: efflux RND transporter periplasmic adaptor subunit [Bacillota bacterium]|nr:efflux RND transporter periplasmic adaptor subunit [Bacillota bacterium]
MKRTLWIGLVVVLAVVGGWYWYSQRTAATKAEAQTAAFDTVRVTRQDLDVIVSASGSVKLSRVVNVRPTVGGTVKALYIKVGDRVRQGQVLMQLDDSELRDRLAQAREALKAAEEKLAKSKSDYSVAPAQLQAQVESARAALASAEQKLASLRQGLKPEEIDQLKSAVNQAAVNRDNALADFQRMKELYAAQAITKQQYEAAEAKYLTAEEALTQAKKKLAAETLPPDPGEVAAAEAAVAQAKANLELARQNLAAGVASDQVTAAQSNLVQAQVAYRKAQEDLAGATIKAPVSGVVMELAYQSNATRSSSNAASPLSVGDVIGPESGWITIADPSLVEVRVPVDETDIAKVKVGLPAKVTADALEGEVFEGTVTNIAPSGVLSDGVVTFDVTVAVADPKGLLKAGMTITADIVVVHLPGALALPREAVIERRGRPAVQVAATGNRFRRVETGFANDTHIQIVSGLSEGETVLVPKPQTKAQDQQNRQNNRPSGGFGFMGIGGGRR